MKITDIKDFKDFKELESRPVNGGVQYFVRFKNNYGASIVKHDFSYGNKDGLWELAVIKIDENNNWGLCYTTKITNDVLGYLSDADVNDLLLKISRLRK